MEKQVKTEVLKTKSFTDRLFSYRMLHGIMMTFCWYQMIGRISVTNPFQFKGCWAYPSYKSDIVNGQVYAVDSVSSPPFPMPNGQFLVIITVPAVIIIALVAVATTYYFYKSDVKKISTITTNSQFS